MSLSLGYSSTSQLPLSRRENEDTWPTVALLCEQWHRCVLLGATGLATLPGRPFYHNVKVLRSVTPYNLVNSHKYF